MTSVMRARWDEKANPKAIKEFLCLDADAIEIGDLMYLQRGTPSDPTTTKCARPANTIWTGTLAGSQGKLAENFLGVAMSSKAANDGGTKVRIAGKGVFAFPVDTAVAFEIGDMVCGVRDAGLNALLDQTVGKILTGAVLGALTESMAIGKVTRRYATATALVEFEILGRAEAGGGVRAFLSS